MWVIVLMFSAAPAWADGPTPTAPAYTDLSQAFVDFWDHTQGLDPDARLAAFKAQVAPLYPAFYAPREGKTQAQRYQGINHAIAAFPEIRDKYIAAQQAFPSAYAGAKAHFAHYFPRSKAQLPTYFLHSLGEMDGGTRTLEGRNVMIFGADGIARYHSPADIEPFMDHELTHMENGAYFRDCDPIWCNLWQEGLAVATAEVMTPGASQHALMLDIPRPIAPEVNAHWREALCTMRAKMNSTAHDDYANMFMVDGDDPHLPPRWGYYVGWRLVRRALVHHTIQQLVHMPNAPAHRLLVATLTEMSHEAGGCTHGSQIMH